MLNKKQPNHLEGEYIMADKNSLIEQMLEHLVNDETQKAEELFHEYVVNKSREIYEGLIEAEMGNDEDEEDEKVKEASDDEEDDDDMNEEFEDVAFEGDDEMDLDDSDPTDSLAGELGDEGDSEEDKSEEELFKDLNSIVDELQARFDSMGGGMGDEMGDDEMKDAYEPELSTVREYVEKVPAGHGAEKKGQAEKADGSAAGLKFSKNDMGGQPLKFGQEDNAGQGTKGGLLNPSTKEDNAGNINVPGAKNGGAFSKKEPGHGAEKKGAAEQADNTGSLFRGRR